MEGLQDVFVRIQTWNATSSNSSYLNYQVKSSFLMQELPFLWEPPVPFYNIP